MTPGTRVEVLIARSGSCEWIPGRVECIRDDRVIVRGDNGEWLPACHELSIRVPVLHVVTEGE